MLRETGLEVLVHVTGRIPPLSRTGPAFVSDERVYFR
jgi:hypothetical protein